MKYGRGYGRGRDEDTDGVCFDGRHFLLFAFVTLLDTYWTDNSKDPAVCSQSRYTTQPEETIPSSTVAKCMTFHARKHSLHSCRQRNDFSRQMECVRATASRPPNEPPHPRLDVHCMVQMDTIILILCGAIGHLH